MAMSTPSKTENVLDYDDLLLYRAQMMSDPAIVQELGSSGLTSWPWRHSGDSHIPPSWNFVRQ
jgi:hypothetical protein